MTITQTIEVPANRRITLEIPPQIPVGKVKLTFTPATDAPVITTDDCPECAKHRDPKTGELCFNSETIAAFEEGDAMLHGEKPAKWYKSLDEMFADLDT